MSSGRSAIETGQILSQSEGNGLYIWNGTAPGGSFTINGLNQALTFGASSLTYDGRGNMTSDGTATYAYDIANRLTGKTGGPTLTYDPAGRLAQVAGGATTRFAYDGGRIVAEYDGSGAMLRRYVPGAGVDETLAWYEGSGTLDRRYLFTDERGSVIAIANAGGSSIGSNTYDEYGRPGALNVGRFQYTGQAWIPELGLYYYKARFYSPELKRFLRPDPIGYAGGMNLYAYVNGDPTNLIDSSGLAAHKGNTDCDRTEGTDECVMVTAQRKPRGLVLISVLFRSGLTGGGGGFKSKSDKNCELNNAAVDVVNGVNESRESNKKDEFTGLAWLDPSGRVHKSTIVSSYSRGSASTAQKTSLLSLVPRGGKVFDIHNHVSQNPNSKYPSMGLEGDQAYYNHVTLERGLDVTIVIVDPADGKARTYGDEYFNSGENYVTDMDGDDYNPGPEGKELKEKSCN